MPVINWVHISDLHFQYSNFDTLLYRDSLLKKIESVSNGKIDLMFITGDIAYKGIFSSETAAYITRIAQATGCPKNNIYMVPGNHDLERSDLRNEAIKIASKDFENVNKSTWKMLTDCGFSDFTSFYEGLKAQSYDIAAPCIVSQPNNLPVNIICMNTALLAGTENDEGNLRIANERFYKSLREIEPDSINIALGHHGIDFLSREDRRRLRNCFETYGVNFYLCGHSHELGVEYYKNKESFTITQINSGALIADGYNEFSFVYGAIDANKKTISYETFLNIRNEWVPRNKSIIDVSMEGKEALRIHKNVQIDMKHTETPEIDTRYFEPMFQGNYLGQTFIDNLHEFMELINLHKQYCLQLGSSFNDSEIAGRITNSFYTLITAKSNLISIDEMDILTIIKNKSYLHFGAARATKENIRNAMKFSYTNMQLGSDIFDAENYLASIIIPERFGLQECEPLFTEIADLCHPDATAVIGISTDNSMEDIIVLLLAASNIKRYLW